LSASTSKSLNEVVYGFILNNTITLLTDQTEVVNTLKAYIVIANTLDIAAMLVKRYYD
jgi:hypothetical protein